MFLKDHVPHIPNKEQIFLPCAICLNATILNVLWSLILVFPSQLHEVIGMLMYPHTECL